ncbi:MAG: sulfite exporter TauE/SafE family protein [Kibdelosporangium sp.]
MTTAVLVLAGVVAGILNVAAAGGSLVSFMALTMLGVPPLQANATNLAATPASFLGGAPTVWRGRHGVGLGLLSTVAGTVVGVWFVAGLTAETFQRLAPALLLIAAMLLLSQPWIQPRIKARDGQAATRGVLPAWLFLTGVYAGSFGAGVGVLLLVVLAFTTSWPWHTVNARKNVVCLATSVVGLAGFAMTGLVIWPLALTLAAAMAIGGLVGQWLTRRVPDDILRSAVAVLAAFGAGHMAA